MNYTIQISRWRLKTKPTESSKTINSQLYIPYEPGEALDCHPLNFPALLAVNFACHHDRHKNRATMPFISIDNTLKILFIVIFWKVWVLQQPLDLKGFSCPNNCDLLRKNNFLKVVMGFSPVASPPLIRHLCHQVKYCRLVLTMSVKFIFLKKIKTGNVLD